MNNVLLLSNSGLLLSKGSLLLSDWSNCQIVKLSNSISQCYLFHRFYHRFDEGDFVFCQIVFSV